MRVTKLVVLALLSVMLPIASLAPAGAQSASGSEATFRFTFTNLSDGQYFTPPNFAAHSPDVDIFSAGQRASEPLEQLAENGDVPGLAAALTSAVDDAGNGVSGVAGEGPVGPGESVEWEVTTSEHYFSLASMIVCTNDGFAGLDSRHLPRVDGAERTIRLKSYDAGSERNTELRADLVPAPFCGEGAGNGESDPALAEDRPIRRHRTIRGIGDLDPSLDWVGRIAELRIERVATAATYEVTVENLTSGQYLTPPNFAGHTRAVDVFQVGQPASPELAQVAENGDVPLLAAALDEAIDQAGHGVSGVGAEAPIGPGEEVSFSFTTTADRFSLVSMVICTNDGFAGIDARRLPRVDGNSKSFYVRAKDAGTEINTELRADLVPAPFCGAGDGSTASNPELAEDGVIRRHRTLRGVGDLDPGLDWRGPVALVTITRVG